MPQFKDRFLPSTIIILILAVFAFGLSGCVPYIIGGHYRHVPSYGTHPPKYFPPEKLPNNVEIGIASWYGPGFQGRPTASGQIYNMYDLTAASKTLPLDSYAYVTDLHNHRSVEVFVNDRGPYVGDRIIDLSYAAARALNMLGPGTALVRIQYLGPKPISSNVLNPYNYHPNQYVRAKRNNSKFIPPALGYTLQFAAYTRKYKAIAKVEQMKKVVPGVHTITKTIKGIFYYKVVFGKFKNLKSAYNFAKIITKYGYDVYITKID